MGLSGALMRFTLVCPAILELLAQDFIVNHHTLFGIGHRDSLTELPSLVNSNFAPEKTPTNTRSAYGNTWP